MSLIPTVYRSTDPGAPVLSGTAGSFAALMDAVLVDGYGTGPDAKPGLGWVRAFSDGHKRAYQNNLAEGGTGMFWRIDDSNAQYVRNFGYHSMSGIDVGVDGFSLAANAWSKSISADTTSRRWFIIGNSRSVYVCIQNGSNFNNYSFVTNFVGDYEALNKEYKFNFCISTSGRDTESSSWSRSNVLAAYGGDSGYGRTYAARDAFGGVIGTDIAPYPAIITGQSYFGFGTGLPYPYPTTGGMMAARVLIRNAGLLCGMYPGLWVPLHNNILTRNQVINNIAGMPGDYFCIESMSNNSTCQGMVSINLPWDY